MSTNGKTLNFRAAKIKGFTVYSFIDFIDKIRQIKLFIWDSCNVLEMKSCMQTGQEDKQLETAGSWDANQILYPRTENNPHVTGIQNKVIHSL